MPGFTSMLAPALARYVSPARRWVEAAGIALLLTAIAVSTYHGVTTDRFARDLDITQAFQKVDIGFLSDVLFWMGVRGISGGMICVMSLVLWFRGYHVEGVLMGLLLVPDASSFILRDIYDRPRPAEALVTVYGGPQGASFPSGTALHWVLFSGFTAYLLPKVIERKKLAYGVGAVFILWIPVMGFWLVNHGRHWPSDVFGGYLYGLLYLVVWIKLYPIAKAWEARNPEALTMASVKRVGIALGLVRSP